MDPCRRSPLPLSWALQIPKIPPTPEVPYLAPLVGVWNEPGELTSVWALRVTQRPPGWVDFQPIARRVLLRYKVRMLTKAEAGAVAEKGGKVVFDGRRADTLELTVRPIPESKEGLMLCGVAVYRTIVRREPGVYREVPLLLYQTIGFVRGEQNAVAEIERQLRELGKSFEAGRKWDAERKAKFPPKPAPGDRSPAGPRKRVGP